MLLAACNDDGDDGGRAEGCPAQICPFDYASFDASPPVSFRTELVGDKGSGPDGRGGILRRACAFGSCHGLRVGSKAELFLGPPLLDGTAPVPATEADVQAVLGGLVNRSSRTLPTMLLVEPFAPERSFLVRK